MTDIHTTRVYFDGHYLGDLCHTGLHTYDDLRGISGKLIRWIGEDIMHWWTVLKLTILIDYGDTSPVELMHRDGILTLIFEDGRRMRCRARMVLRQIEIVEGYQTDHILVALLDEPDLDLADGLNWQKFTDLKRRKIDPQH